MLYLALIMSFFFILAFFSFVLFSLFYKEKPIERLKFFDQDYVQKQKVEELKGKKTSPLKLISKLVPSVFSNNKRAKKIEKELIRADIPITYEELLIIKLLFSTILAFLGYSLTRDIFIMLLVFFVIWNMPGLIINMKKKERLKLFNEQINEGIVLISNSLKAGYSFLQALTVVVDELKEPFSKEFGKLLKEMTLGISTEEAFKGMLDRVESEDLKLLVNAILIQKDIGGNLAEILDNISETIRERQKIKNEVKTLTAQGRLSGIIITLMPVILGLMIYMFNKEYIMLLFTTTIGLVMLGMAFVSQVIGIFMIRKIVDVEL